MCRAAPSPPLPAPAIDLCARLKADGPNVCFRREAQAAQERAETEIALCTEQGFALFLAGGAMYRGWALAEQGQGKDGIAQIHQGLTAYRATGAEMGRPYFLALLAEAYGKVGEAEQGLAALVDALAQVEKTGERQYEAELYRLKGTLTLEARDWFHVPTSLKSLASSLRGGAAA